MEWTSCRKTKKIMELSQEDHDGSDFCRKITKKCNSRRNFMVEFKSCRKTKFKGIAAGAHGREGFLQKGRWWSRVPALKRLNGIHAGRPRWR
jgi:hypothetical protein